MLRVLRVRLVLQWGVGGGRDAKEEGVKKEKKLGRIGQGTSSKKKREKKAEETTIKVKETGDQQRERVGSAPRESASKGADESWDDRVSLPSQRLAGDNDNISQPQ